MRYDVPFSKKTYATIEFIHTFAPEILTFLNMFSLIMTKARYFCRV